MWRDSSSPGLSDEEINAVDLASSGPEDRASWKLVGVIKADDRYVAYLISPTNESVVVRESDSFGEDLQVVEIGRTNLRYKTSAGEVLDLRLYHHPS